MNKILVDHLDNFLVTSDTSTIVNNLDIIHPASRLLSMASSSQNLEIGDGNNFVVTFAGELLGCARLLIHDGVHPSEIVSGYSFASKKALENLEKLVLPGSDKFDNMNEKEVIHRIKGSVASKKYGYENELSRLIARACIMVSSQDTKNFITENVRVSKIIGGGIEDSNVIKGMVIAQDTNGSIKSFRDSRVAIYTQSI